MAAVAARAPASPTRGRFPCVIPVQSYQYRNLARAGLTGAELEGAYDWGRRFKTLAASHIDGRDRATRESLLTVPPDRLSTTPGLRVLGAGSRSAAAVTLVDARIDLPASARSRATEAYGLVDLFASSDVSDRIRADVIVRNALDKRYRPYLDALASPGLVAKAALSITFATR